MIDTAYRLSTESSLGVLWIQTSCLPARSASFLFLRLFDALDGRGEQCTRSDSDAMTGSLRVMGRTTAVSSVCLAYVNSMETENSLSSRAPSLELLRSCVHTTCSSGRAAVRLVFAFRGSWIGSESLLFLHGSRCFEKMLKAEAQLFGFAAAAATKR